VKGSIMGHVHPDDGRSRLILSLLSHAEVHDIELQQ